MNRIYRRVWNRARQCWVVVSEIARGRGGRSCTRAVRTTLAALVITPFTASAADTSEQALEWWRQQALHAFYAAPMGAEPAASGIGVNALRVLRRDAVAYTTAGDWNVTSGAESMAVGPEARAEGGESLSVGLRAKAIGKNTVAVGNNAVAQGAQSVAVGKDANTRGTHSVAVGFGAVSNTGGYAVAIGTYAEADGIGTTSLGHDAKAYSNNSIAIGSGAQTVYSSAGVSRIAIGGNAFAGSAGYSGAVALGGNARAEYDSVVIGHDAKATAVGAIAIGRNSLATEGNSVSVGNVSTQRRIVNVEDARLSTTSTDAVTGKQLHATNTRIAAVGNMVTQSSASSQLRVGQENTGTSVNFSNKSGATRYLNGIRNGALTATSTDAVTGQQLLATNQGVTKAQSTADAINTRLNAAAVALGQSAVAESSGRTASAAIGSSAQAYNSSSIAMGADARAGVDADGAKSTASGAVALGAFSRSGNGAVATGLRATAFGDRAIAIGSDASAAATHATAVGYKATASANQSTALGRETTASGLYATAVGNLAKATAQSALATGVNAQATADSSSAMGSGAKATHANSVALGAGSVSYSANSVSVGNATTKRKIQYVADGGVGAGSTDAVTGSQLFATNQNVAAAQNKATAAQASAAAAKSSADTALAKADQLGGLVGQAAANGNVRLGAENTGNALDVRNKANANRTISGVADAGLTATSAEAVTGRQLHATNTQVTTAQNTATAAQTAATGARTVADNALAKTAALDGLVRQTAANGSVRLGAENTGNVLDVRNKANANRTISGVADAALSAASTEAVTGRQLHATNTLVTTAQNTAVGAKTTADDALGKATVLSGLVGQVSTNGNLRLGADNTGTILDVANKSGGKRRIYNIANGVLGAGSTDAVTGQQLYTTNTNVETQRQTLAAHSLALSDQSGLIAGNRSDLDALRSEFDDFDPDLEGVVRFEADGAIDLNGGKVRGVAAGDISSATSTEAVNGGQLFATNSRVSNIEEQSRFFVVGSDSLSEEARAGLLGVAIGDGAEASLNEEGATAVGAFAAARGKNSVALGRAAHVHEGAEDGFALGGRSQVKAYGGVALGAESQVLAAGGVALGLQSIADESNTVSIGNAALKRRLTNIARGTDGHNAVSVDQMSEALATLGGGAGLDSIGNIVVPTYNLQGGVQNTVEDALLALDGAVTTGAKRASQVEEQLRSVFQEGPSVRSDGLNQLTLAGANGMVLSNLADGRIAAGSRDAVTGNQLFDAKQEIARNRGDLDELRGERDGILSRGMVSVEQGGVIDFGGARLTGMADGVVSADSRDAISGRQLFRFSESIREIEHQGRFFKIGTDSESEDAYAGWFGVAIGESAEASRTGEGGTAVGAFTKALGINSVALGRAAMVNEGATEGFALGASSGVEISGGVALGAQSQVKASATNGVALGYASYADEANTVSIGSTSLKRRVVNVERGKRENDAATVGQLNDSLATLGGGAHLDENGNIVGPTFSLQGRTQGTLNDALETLDSAVITSASRVDRVESQLRSVFQDSSTLRSDGLNQLTFTGANGMVLSNVANGAIAAGSRDAVNGGQLHSLQQQLNGRVDGLEQRIDGQPQSRALSVASVEAPSATSAHSPVADESVTPPVADTGAAPPVAPQANSPKAESPTPQVDTADLEKMLARANEYSDGISREVDRRLDKMDKRFNRMAAMSSAQTAMAMNTAGLATYNRLGAGVGYAEGESAMAVGYQRVLNEKGSATFSLNGAFTNSGERSMGVGVGIGW